MIELKPNKDALNIYFDEYNFKEKIYADYNEFYKKRENCDVVGAYLDERIVGCFYFINEGDFYSFHVAFKDEARGKWMHYYKSIILWMLEKYKNIGTAVHIEDKKLNSLLLRSGFKKVRKHKDFNWYRYYE